ncbi:patatin-like protein [Sandaracinobacteroides saxicola]|uniref:Patatin-like protein n=1 Tax=Sandaracinobacteroides saxicola TaxID=2759707 RepID=A0A7G5IIW4_9SPHN|nr:patatin-like protein [Sandaracinobacteroides saxicola]QMW23306.1 patatin-like protein [Sandaracinobacteroides saxicola]
MREKELRLALVCYGGVSLAVYMHGITKELWKLLRASEAFASGQAVSGDSEPVWAALLQALPLRLRVVTDIIAGASAGGINGILLGHAIVGGHDMEALRDLWLAKADIDVMLDPDARPASRLSRIYAEPFAWWAAKASNTLAAIDSEVRAEVTMKLSRFVRSRWFAPPFSGDGLTLLLDEAIAAMRATGPPLLPATQSLDLFVTVTDYHGMGQRLMLHSPTAITETEHRRIISFSVPPGKGRVLGERPALVFAARATASFPGAFPPAGIGEIDRMLAARGEPWPGRAAFVAASLSGDRPVEELRLIDGSVLNNAPFGPAIATLRHRPAHRSVDRRFVYIDPSPGVHGLVPGGDRPEPGFFTTILRALADIPREQPIRDNLEAIAAVSQRIRRLRGVVEGMTPAVDAAIARAVGGGFFLLPLSAPRLARARSRIQSVAAKEAGFAYAAYAHLKLRVVIDEAAALLAQAAGMDALHEQDMRQALRGHAEAVGAMDVAAVTAKEGPSSAYVGLMRALDLGFRVRRLRFVIRRVTQLAEAADSGEAPDAADAMKARLHLALAPFLRLRRGDEVLAPVAAQLRAGDIAGAVEALKRWMDLSALDAAADRAVLDVSGGKPSRGLRQAVIRAWLGFPFYDIALLPLMQDDGFESFDEIKVDRISPEDATALKSGGTRATLKGWQMNAFGAFFSRAWRENDYLWGRLHAAERLVDIVVSAVDGEMPVAITKMKRQLFAAILASEREHLTLIHPLIDELEGYNRAPTSS